jgi:hypothetical protein
LDDRPRSELAYFSPSSFDGQLGIEGRPTCRFGQPPDLSASWSWYRDQLEVRSDALGFRPLYYWADSSGIVVAKSVHPILQRIKNPSLDPVALSVFLRTGLVLGDDTLFLGVRQLGPNSVLTWSPLDGLHVRRGPQPNHRRKGVLRRAVRKLARSFGDHIISWPVRSPQCRTAASQSANR